MIFRLTPIQPLCQYRLDLRERWNFIVMSKNLILIGAMLLVGARLSAYEIKTLALFLR
jgi:hypothetical protein